MSDFKIKLSTEADTKGAQILEDSIDAVAQATRKAAEDSKRAGDDEATAARRLAFELSLVEQRAKAVSSAFQDMPVNPFGGQLNSATGVDASAQVQDLDRVTAAQEKLKSVSSEYKKELPGYSAEVEKFADALQTTASKSDAAAVAVGKTNQILKAGIVRNAAQALAAAGVELSQFGKSLAEVDPELGKTMEGLGGLATNLGTVTGFAAQGAAFGPWGAAIGAAVGVGAAAIKPFMEDMEKQIELAKQSADHAVTMGEKYQELLNKTSGDGLKKWARDLGEIRTEQEGINRAIQADIDLSELKRQGEENRIAQALNLEEAQLRGAASTGEIDQATLVARLEEIADQRLLLKEQSATAREQLRVAQAQARANAEQAELERVQSEIERQEAKLEKLIASANRQNTEAKGLRAISDADPDDFASAGRAQDAEQKLAATESSIETLRGAIDELKSNIPAISEKVGLAVQEVSILQTQATESIQQIAESANAEALVEKTNALAAKVKETGEAAAVKIGEAIAEVEPQNQRQVESLDVLKKALADGEITAAESKSVAEAINNLTGVINGNVKELMDVAFSSQADAAQMASQIQQLKAGQAEMRQTLDRIQATQ